MNRRSATAMIGMLGTACYAQVATDYSADNVGTDENVIAPATLVPQTPDTTGIWYHIEHKETELAIQTLRRLQNENPGWQPSGALVRALAALQSRQIGDAISDTPATVSPRTEPSLFLKLARLNEAQRKALTPVFLQQANAQAEAAENADFHGLLGWTYLSKKQYLSAIHHFSRAHRLSPSDASKQGQVLAITGQFNVALQHDDLREVARLREHYADIAFNDQIIALAWSHFETKQYKKALEYFILGGSLSGQFLSLTRLGRAAEAADLACVQKTEPSMQSQCAGYWSLQQAERYQRKAYIESLSAAEQIAQVRSLSDDEQTLVAWAQLKSGREKQAAASFTSLLKKHPENLDFAAALLSVSPENTHTSLAKTAPAVKRVYSNQQAAVAWQRKQFLLSGQYDHQLVHDNHNLSTPQGYGFTVYAGGRGRQRTGEQGLGNFDIFHGYVGLTDTHQQLRWDIRLDYEQLYSGRPAANSWFGDGQVDGAFNSLSGFEDTGVHSSIQYEMPALTLYGELNYALFSQPQDAEPTGQLSATWFSNQAVAAINVYHLRAEDSLLSMGSTYFENSKEAFGGVYRSGLKALYSGQIMPNAALSIAAVADNYQGRSTQSNQHRGIRLEFSYDFAGLTKRPIDYWRMGPYISWEGFDDNRSGFTRGHGGYFSPQDLWSTGIYAELLTDEGKRWQVKAAVSAGYNWIRQARANRFPEMPLSSDGTSAIPSDKNNGLAGQLTLEGQYKISSHWLVAGYLQNAYAVEYQSTWAGLEIRWHAGEANGVTSDTLLLNDAAVTGYVF